METRISKFPSVLGILLLFTCLVSHTKATFNPESFRRKLVALEKVLDYIDKRPHQMNLDATFGVTLTEANLIAALLHENVPYLENEFFIALKKMVALSDSTRRKLINTVLTSGKNTWLQSNINNPILWIKPISWMKIPSKVKIENQRLSYSEVKNLIQYETLDEVKSDQCIIGIINSTLNGECQILENCIEMLMEDDYSTGYILTHKLLMVQFAKAFGCRETESVPFTYLIPKYCAKILQDLVNCAAWNFPYNTQDLMMEQITLCGMEGYYEFVDKHYEDLILSWPHQSGCFSTHGFSEEHKIARRSTSLTDFGCENHITGLGAASLSLFIRENIENKLNQR